MGINITDILGGSVLESVKGIIGEFKVPPEKKLELQELVEQNSAVLKQKQIEYMEKLADSEAREVEAINSSMQAEAKSEHWMQWAWRPTVGFTFAALIIANYIVLPYFPQFKPIEVPGGVWNAMLVVLGCAAATRGLEKWQNAKNNA